MVVEAIIQNLSDGCCMRGELRHYFLTPQSSEKGQYSHGELADVGSDIEKSVSSSTRFTNATSPCSKSSLSKDRIKFYNEDILTFDEEVHKLAKNITGVYFSATL